MLRILSLGVLALALPLAALAGTVVESFKGEVQAGGAAVKQGQRLVSPTAITTGPGAQVFLKFDDGMQIVLGENSLLRMVDFRYTASNATDRGVFELLRGSARVVTGKIAANNPKQFFFRMPQTQLTIEQPADFTVALVNPAYIAVKSGTVLSSNGYGAVPLGAGSTTGIAGNAVGAGSDVGFGLSGERGVGDGQSQRRCGEHARRRQRGRRGRNRGRHRRRLCRAADRRRRRGRGSCGGGSGQRRRADAAVDDHAPLARAAQSGAKGPERGLSYWCCCSARRRARSPRSRASPGRPA